ncbi:AAA family ATPase [Daejeonella lutea]|uniref:AAA domain (Dynein-related subfamily) n=1 Tax=Daejeonella lutea TaxID=572036 RepID=A0A1T5B1S4_9SPHI|nr:AAA family ATPase [Daejeonella lutea]SKB40930.1 AAA domain (dynein-related subfamily) [Daejeonella lutea]
MESLKKIINNIQVWDGWLNSYKKFVPMFIKEASTGQAWDKWDKEAFFEYFEKSNGQCVSSLKQGYFTKSERDEIKKNWDTIAPHIERIAKSQDVPLFVEYELLKKEIRKYTNQDRRAATYRMIAGLQPNLLCTIVKEEDLRNLYHSLIKEDDNKLPRYQYNWFKDSVEICNLFKTSSGSANPIDLITLPWQVKEYLENEHEIKAIPASKSMILKETLNLLKYKKQIILQGPPGTGKTRLAKMIAQDILLDEMPPFTLTKEIIKNYMVPGLKFPSAKDRIEYEVEKVGSSGISIIASSKNSYVPLYNEIITAYNDQVWDKEGAITKGNDSYSAAIAKYIYIKQQEDRTKIEDSPQFRLIQFHPSYTYEDFVRGIVAETKGERIEYKNVNKILGKFADEAFNNLELSKTDNSKVQKSLWVDSNFEDFKEEIRIHVENQPITLSNNITVFDVEPNCFRYAKDWSVPSRINFKDFKILLAAVLNGTLQIDDNRIPKELSVHAHYRFTYYLALLRLFFEKHNFNQTQDKQPLKNYVLIIDEINRANLSSVLGELIYALEYRGDKVESMYEVENENSLVLPSNLYIIGTMNTADRSVGHIDYAVRRRFAFVDILPEKLEDTDEMIFFPDLFKQVAELFIKNHDEYLGDKSLPLIRADYLSPEFEAKDVWLGHSYFIQKKVKGTGELVPKDFGIRVKYEIIPILREYVKDGVLNEKAIAKIDEIEKAHSV